MREVGARTTMNLWGNVYACCERRGQVFLGSVDFL